MSCGTPPKFYYREAERGWATARTANGHDLELFEKARKEHTMPETTPDLPQAVRDALAVHAHARQVEEALGGKRSGSLGIALQLLEIAALRAIAEELAQANKHRWPHE